MCNVCLIKDVTGACACASQVQEASDLDVDFLFVDVEDVLPQLYQAVEVVFMGSSMDRITSNGERWEAESVLLLPAQVPVLCGTALTSAIACWAPLVVAPLHHLR